MINEKSKKKVFIVAEVGLNHNGKLRTAKKLVDVAVDAGADAVKFQTYWSIKGFEHLNFTKPQWGKLFRYCESVEIKWFSTPFDLEAVEFLDSWGMDTWKIPSNNIVLNNKQLLGLIKQAKSREHTIISTGASNFIRIGELIEMFGDKKVSILHCVSKYPCPIKDLNLRRIARLKSGFNLPVGFSDHSLGVFAAPITAIEMGAEIIEKHITLSRKAKGPDHKASLEPHELKTMVQWIRGCEDKWKV
jgi:N,N'-diacetyllegionaminate synthase